MQLAETILQAGIVGCGGAGFPTHAKYSGGQISTVIINGAECEPLLHTDRYLMENRAGDMIRALDWILKETGAGEGVIALKKTYTKEIQALTKAIEDCNSSVRLHLMDSFYPAGDEQTMVYEVTGKVVPPAGIPLNVGCVVNNAATLCCIADAMSGKPFTEKYITITGEVRRPMVVKVPLGTPVEACLALAGGATVDDYAVVNGGPMMGKFIKREQLKDTYVTKTMSGLIVVPADSRYAGNHQVPVAHMLNRAKSACIQCSFCTQFCPRALLGHPIKPHKIMRKLASGEMVQELIASADTDILNAALCCECGICEVYACPMGLQPRRINSMVKGELAKAGIRYQRPDAVWEALPERNLRKAPTSRVAARAGVGAYTRVKDFPFTEAEAGSIAKVRLSLRQGIGAPSEPVVRCGDRVTAGQLIAACPEGKLGSALHASISGVVTVGDGYIEISNERGAWS